MTYATDYLIAKQGLNKLYDLMEQKQWREARELLDDIEQAEYRLKHYVASRLKTDA